MPLWRRRGKHEEQGDQHEEQDNQRSLVKLEPVLRQQAERGQVDAMIALGGSLSPRASSFREFVWLVT
jgi:uncharacterized protein (UPF0261 family)